jgi:hypothetical protein
MTEITPSLTMKRVEDWKSRLIDLSRKNNLLYFNRSKRGNLPLTQPDMQKIFEGLVLKKKRLEFWQPPEETKKAELPEKTKGKGEAKASKSRAKTTQPEIKTNQTEEPRRPTANQLLSGSLSRIDLEQNLKNLERRSLLDYMERGVRILHVAFGTLNWIDVETKENVQSPLLFVPVELL